MFYITNNLKIRVVNIHIGNIIEKKLTELGMKKSEFAKRIHKQRQNINDLLSKESIDTNDLILISEILKFDFFKELCITLYFPYEKIIFRSFNSIYILAFNMYERFV